MIAAPLQGNFDGGEISPLVYGRVDSERYKRSLATCFNWIPSLQGSLFRRPGTYYVGQTGLGSAAKSRLIPFKYSTTQAYILEFYQYSIKIYANYGVVVDGGNNPIVVTTPYTTADLPDLRVDQSADVLYITHPHYPPAKLERISPTDWRLLSIPLTDGPYQAINKKTTTLAPSATTGTATVTVGPAKTITGCANNGSGLIRVTATAHGYTTGDWVYIKSVVGTTEANGWWRVFVVDANNFDLQGSTFTHAYVSGGASTPGLNGGGFTWPAPSGNVAGDLGWVGTPVRIQHSSTWGWGYITAMNGDTFTVSVQKPFGATTASASWAMGLYQFAYDTSDFSFPSAVCFHEDRQCYTGTKTLPQRIDGSNVADYDNFSPSDTTGTVSDANAISFSLNSDDVNVNKWLSPDEKALLAGSSGAEWTVRPSVTSQAITPTNISAKRSNKYGSASIAPVQVGRQTLYVMRGARRLRELMYYFDVDGFRSTDLSELAEHITGTGVVDMAYQSLPHPIVWLVRDDGALLGVTYDRNMQELRVGWHWHFLGGQSYADGTPPVIESIAVIPSPDGTRDDVWMIVKRYINGSVVRTIEYMKKIFEDIDDQNDAYFVDCGLTYDTHFSANSIANDLSGHITVALTANHGFSGGEKIRIEGVVGVEDSNGVSLLNGKTWTVGAIVSSDAFHIAELATTSSLSYTPYVSGGTIRKLATTISGLTHLENETVSVYADGCTLKPLTVSNTGTLTLPFLAARVSVGYGYNSDAKLLRLEAGAHNGTSLGKVRRTNRVGVMLHRSQGLLLGRDFDNLDRVQFATQGVTPSGEAPALFSGIATHEAEFDYDFDNNICFRVDTPVPCTLQAVMPLMETQDRA